MPRKITTKAVDAFLAGREFSTGNTTVEVRPFQLDKFESVVLLLHGNPIARRRVGRQDSTMVCDGGWQTATTKERLNGLPGVSVHQKAGQWYLNGVKWDGSWTMVANGYVVYESTDGWRVRCPDNSDVLFSSAEAARAYAELGRANARAV